MKKTYHNTNISQIEKKIVDHGYDKYITTKEFEKLTADNFEQANSVTKTDIDDFVENFKSNKT